MLCRESRFRKNQGLDYSIKVVIHFLCISRLLGMVLILASEGGNTLAVSQFVTQKELVLRKRVILE